MRSIVFLALVLVMAGCGPETTRVSQTITPETQINRLLKAGEYQQAAEELIKLSQLYPEDAVQYLQQATEIYLDSGDVLTAKVTQESIPVNSALDRVIKRLLAARIAMTENNPVQALSYLQDNPPANAPVELIIRYYRTRIDALASRGNIIDEVTNRIELTRFLSEDNDLLENNWVIWNRINQIPLTQLKQYRVSGNTILKSWSELAIINQTSLFEPELFSRSISMWQQQYPNHPANMILDREILRLNSGNNPTHVAICLPFSGRYRELSQAIRDGFIAAWFTSKTFRPELSIYDSDAININDVYRKAIAEGADFIVGPLEKNELRTLMENADLKVPVLALNQVDLPVAEKLLPLTDELSSIPKFIQFGYSPEDEARQIAGKALAKGYKKALIITPNNERGDRLFNAFQEQLEFKDGMIMEHIRYPVDTQEYKTPVKSLLNITSSEKRVIDLRNRLGRNISSETRQRSDADFIFMVADPDSARRIVPEFRFYQTNIPIYSTSDIYPGVNNPQFNKDMDGVIFTQIPWILEQNRYESPIQQLVNRNWAEEKSDYRKYYALGVDSYLLIPNLSRLVVQNTVKYPGETGDLFLERDGRFHRELMWATFTEGTAKSMEY